MLLSDWLIFFLFFFFFLNYFIPRLCIETMFVCFSLSINKCFMIDLWLFLLIFSFQIFLQTPTYISDKSKTWRNFRQRFYYYHKLTLLTQYFIYQSVQQVFNTAGIEEETGTGRRIMMQCGIYIMHLAKSAQHAIRLLFLCT